MEDLDLKYRTDHLTISELKTWGDQISAMDDSALEDILETVWNKESYNEDNVDEETLSRIKSRIDEETSEARPSVFKPMFTRVLRIAAAVMLPLLLISTLYLYQENKQLAADTITFSTGKGERASITLPDGTQVSLNYDTRLVYTPKLYSKDQRRVELNGEAYFDVAKNKDCPFFIDAKNLEVKVLGTKFNLLARNKHTSAELCLDEGHVQFTSLVNKEAVTMTAGDYAVLDYATGHISITQKNELRDATAWKRNEMVFQDKALEDVIEELKDVYGVKFNLPNSALNQGGFTGTLPLNNLELAVKIICSSYEMNYTIQGNKVVMSPK